jgi:mRNA interferase RelE/StbE
MDRLQDSPLAGSQVKRLKGKLREYYRYRVEDYRILYFVDKEGKIVYVDIIQHRKDIYRRL